MVFLEIVILILVAVIFFLIFKNREWQFKFDIRLKEKIEQEEEKIRRDAILRSSRVLSGKTLEKLVPFLEDFPYDPHDIRWLGDPVDFVVFNGLSSSRVSEGNLDSIVLCEVKSGDSELNKTQKRIRKLVEDKKVFWDEFRIGEKEK